MCSHSVCVCDVPEDADLDACLKKKRSLDQHPPALVVHGADLSCAELCCSSVFSVLSHPSPLRPLSFPPSVIPISCTLGHCSLMSPFSVFLSTIRTIAHTTHAVANTSSLFFLFCSRCTSFSSHTFLFHPSVLSILGTLCTFTHSLSFSFSPLSPNLALICICLLISKCSSPPPVLSWCC